MTKIHLPCTSKIKPMYSVIVEGKKHDIKIAPDLIKRNDMSCLIADKAYWSKKL